MNIGIPLSKYAYTPEAYAYQKYLSNLGWSVQLDYQLDPNNDINLMFMGIDPFWKKKEGKAFIIHEYQSLSTPSYSAIKDFLKKKINKKPSARIFLNEVVSSQLNFTDTIPYIFRDMGVDPLFFQEPSENPIYDIVYCGSIKNRVGLIECFFKIAYLGYTLIVLGDVEDEVKIQFNQFSNVLFYGRANREEVAEIYKLCKYGLNFTPNIFPYNIQTSTKTLEYLASGLQVLSNQYHWSKQFSRKFNIIWLEDFYIGNFNNSQIDKASFELEYSWDSVLDQSCFNNFLKKVVE